MEYLADMDFPGDISIYPGDLWATKSLYGCLNNYACSAQFHDGTVDYASLPWHKANNFNKFI